jgi:hypothetical protein
MIGVIPPQVKIAGVLTVGVALFSTGWYFSSLWYKADEAKLQRDSYKSLAEGYEKQQKEDLAKAKQKDSELEQLKTNVLKYPDVDVRVCRVELSSPVSAGGTQGQELHPGTGVVSQNTESVSTGPGSDPGPELFGLADAADRLAAGCRAL